MDLRKSLCGEGIESIMPFVREYCVLFHGGYGWQESTSSCRFVGGYCTPYQACGGESPHHAVL